MKRYIFFNRNSIPSDYSIKIALRIYKIVKKIMDAVLSSFGIVLMLPSFLLIAIAIRLDSSGSIFFMQKRCGKNGREFYMYKFRTMIKDAASFKENLKNEVEGPVFKVKNDPRITKVGRILRTWSLDELPQLLNVLKGEMSLVGPRPLSKEEMTGNDNWREIRLLVKPGMTGLWQIKGRNNGKFNDWIKYDIEYVQKKSLLLDIKILFLTINAVLRREGAY
jgi:lipopolysaccharide/colanic/teichoic acid biosynthesis glycosyltransferase